jgi:4-carboxymuconolactone decarboxylase
MNCLPALTIAQGTDRFPPIDPSLWTNDMQVAATELIAGPRGEVRGPFVPLMRSPDLLDRTQKLGAFLRYECAIEPRLREFATCVVARHWSQPYEWRAHARLAAEAGVAPATLASLRDGSLHSEAPDDERLVFAICTKLLANHQLDDSAFDDAVHLLGEQGLIELAALCGYYSLLAIVMNLARTPFSGQAFALPSEED